MSKYSVKVVGPYDDRMVRMLSGLMGAYWEPASPSDYVAGSYAQIRSFDSEEDRDDFIEYLREFYPEGKIWKI